MCTCLIRDIWPHVVVSRNVISREYQGVFNSFWNIQEEGDYCVPAKMRNPNGWGVLCEYSLHGGVWIFSGTTQ